MQELNYDDVQGEFLVTGKVPRSYENTVLSLMSRVEKLEADTRKIMDILDASRIARKAYETYSKSESYKRQFKGAPIRDWDDLPPDVRQTWDACVQAVLKECR
jgi:hypothetical protein